MLINSAYSQSAIVQPPQPPHSESQIPITHSNSSSSQTLNTQTDGSVRMKTSTNNSNSTINVNPTLQTNNQQLSIPLSLSSSSSSSTSSSAPLSISIPRKNMSTTKLSLMNINYTSSSNIYPSNSYNYSSPSSNCSSPSFLFDNNTGYYFPPSSYASSLIEFTSSSLSSSTESSVTHETPNVNSRVQTPINSLASTPSLNSILSSKRFSSYSYIPSLRNDTTSTNTHFTELHNTHSINSENTTSTQSTHSSSEYYASSLSSWNDSLSIHPLAMEQHHNAPQISTPLKSMPVVASSHATPSSPPRSSSPSPSSSSLTKSLVSRSISFISSLAESTKKSTLLMNASTALTFNSRITDTRANYYNSMLNYSVDSSFDLGDDEDVQEQDENSEEIDEEKTNEESIDTDDDKFIAEELTTFNTTCCHVTKHHRTTPVICSSSPALSMINKSREARLNPQFLRFYAQDYSAKSKGLLNVTDYEIDIYQEEQEKLYHKMVSNERETEISIKSSSSSSDEEYEDDEYDQDHNQDCSNAYGTVVEYNTSSLSPDDSELSSEDEDEERMIYRSLLKIGYLSREKLWSNVILPPREDKLSLFNDFSRNEYIYAYPSELNNRSSCSPSLTRLKGENIPWINHLNFQTTKNIKLIKPIGYLPHSNTQFTVKGWANKRWISINEFDQ